MKPAEIVSLILKERERQTPLKNYSEKSAVANIALCKYWGKRNQILNLPVTSSLSVSLTKGCHLKLSLSDTTENVIFLDGNKVAPDSVFAHRLSNFLDLFSDLSFRAEIHSEIPVGAGLASSACGFASVVRALDDLFDWQLLEQELSVLARLGSGSACRSIWNGFVEWKAGERPDGLDSHGEPLNVTWPDFCLGLLVLSDAEKPVSSRTAMKRTVETSLLYRLWPEKVAEDLIALKEAIINKDFELLGKTAESNALTMHALMLSAIPPVCYFLPETVNAMHKIWQLRAEGLPLYFTQDAGPSLKLLFKASDAAPVLESFPGIEISGPWSPPGNIT